MKNDWTRLFEEGNCDEAWKICMEAWDLLPEPKYKQPMSWFVVTNIVKYGIETKRVAYADKFLALLFICALDRADSEDREFWAGRLAYENYVPIQYRAEDLSKLIKEKRYEEIFNKYGEKIYKEIAEKSMFKEIKAAKGNIRAILWKIRHEVKKLGIRLGVAFLGITAISSTENHLVIQVNKVKYESEIEEYNKKISDYAKKINSMNLSDIQIFMKVIDDMWNNIKGYARPEKNIWGYLELDLATEEGYGVCRNMASDIAKKLNEINPEYNARTINVKINKDGIYEIADVNVKILNHGQEIQNEEEKEKVFDFDKIITDISGNHVVTLVDLQKDNITLVLDPTNPGIGIYKNGKITMFNSDKENGIKFIPKEYSTATLKRRNWWNSRYYL